MTVAEAIVLLQKCEPSLGLYVETHGLPLYDQKYNEVVIVKQDEVSDGKEESAWEQEVVLLQTQLYNEFGEAINHE